MSSVQIPLDQLEGVTDTMRANAEDTERYSFSFVPTVGPQQSDKQVATIQVTNHQKDTPSVHFVQIDTSNGVPVSCSCKSFKYRSVCSHVTACAIREPLYEAAKRFNRRRGSDQ